MPYHYKVTLARKNEKKDKSLLPDILDRFAAAFRSSLHRAALRDLFIDHDASLTDAVPEVRLRHTCRQETLFDELRNRIDEPIEFSFFERERLFPFLSWRRSFATALVFAVTFAGFIGLSSRNLQAASEQPQTAPQKQTVKGSLEFLPTDCPPVMQLSNCVNASLTGAERSMNMKLMAQYPGSHSNTEHSNTPAHNQSVSEHSQTPASDTHSNTSHVNLAPGDTIF
ncbi:MAG: hypothetical protein AB2L14_30530 [Candidatus Xenobiia bacterium LiM19]